MVPIHYSHGGTHIILDKLFIYDCWFCCSIITI